MDEHAVVATRRSLHAVAERLLAGPQYREHGEIQLQVTPGGFGQFAGPTPYASRVASWSRGPAGSRCTARSRTSPPRSMSRPENPLTFTTSRPNSAPPRR
jgi:hypothetical protein